jgi:hypothetical protein
LKARNPCQRQFEVGDRRAVGREVERRLLGQVDHGPNDAAIPREADRNREHGRDLCLDDARGDAQATKYRTDRIRQIGGELADVSSRKEHAEERSFTDAQNETPVTDVEKIGVPVAKLARRLLNI